MVNPFDAPAMWATPESAPTPAPVAAAAPAARYDDLFQKHGAAKGVDPLLLKAQTNVESKFNPNALSPVGAQGLMQLMPPIQKKFGVTNPSDPDQNIGAGAALMKENLAASGGDAGRALLMYHGGPDEKNWGPKTIAYRESVLAEHARLMQEQQPQANNPFDAPGMWEAPQEGGRGVVGTLKDTGIALAQGVVDFPGSLYGLANAASLGAADKATAFLDEKVRGLPPGEGETFSTKLVRAKQIIQDAVGQSSQMTAKQQELGNISQNTDSEFEGFFASLGYVMMNPDLAAHMFAQSLPSMVGIGAATRALVGRAVAKGASKELAEKAGERANVIANAVLEGGSTANDTMQAIMGMSDADLRAASSDYRELVDTHHKTPQEAKAIIANRAVSVAAVIAGAIGGAATKFTGAGKFEADVFGKGLSIKTGAKALATHVGQEALEEGVQNAGDVIGQNVGTKVSGANPKQTVMQGVGASAGAGAGFGAVTGGAFHAAGTLLGKGEKPEPPAAPPPPSLTFGDKTITNTTDLQAHLDTIAPQDRLAVLAQALHLTPEEPNYATLKAALESVPPERHAALIGQQVFGDKAPAPAVTPKNFDQTVEQKIKALHAERAALVANLPENAEVPKPIEKQMAALDQRILALQGEGERSLLADANAIFKVATDQPKSILTTIEQAKKDMPEAVRPTVQQLVDDITANPEAIFTHATQTPDVIRTIAQAMRENEKLAVAKKAPIVAEPETIAEPPPRQSAKDASEDLVRATGSILKQPRIHKVVEAAKKAAERLGQHPPAAAAAIAKSKKKKISGPPLLSEAEMEAERARGIKSYYVPSAESYNQTPAEQRAIEVSKEKEKKALDERLALRVPKANESRGVNVEVAPNPQDAKLTEKFNKLTEAQKTEVTKEIGDRLIPDAMKDMDISHYAIEHTVGGFEGGTNPSIIVHFGKDVTHDKMVEAGKVLGHVFSQQAVIAYDEAITTGESLTGFVKVKPARALSYEESSALYKAVFKAVPEASGFTAREGALVFGNFSSLSDSEFHAKIDAALKGLGEDQEFATEFRKFRSDWIEPATLEGTRYGKGNESQDKGAVLRGQGRNHPNALRADVARSIADALGRKQAAPAAAGTAKAGVGDGPSFSRAQPDEENDEPPRVRAKREAVAENAGSAPRGAQSNTAGVEDPAVRQLHHVVDSYLKTATPRGMFERVRRGTVESDLARAVAKSFNKELVVFKNNNPEIFDFNGLAPRGHSLFVNENTSKPFLNVTGHELLHKLKHDAPDIYAALVAAIKPHINLHAQGNHAAKLRYQAYKEGATISEDKILEELVADAAGDAFADPKFWQGLAEKEPSLFGEIANRVKEFLQRILDKLTRANLGSSQYFNDIAKVRDHIADSYIEWAKRGNQSPSDAADMARSDFSNRGGLWYSALERALVNTKQESAPVAQWQGLINGLMSKGVKKSEIDWSGIMDWLKMQTGMVSREQITDYLSQHGVQVDEVQHGGEADNNRDEDISDKAYELASEEWDEGISKEMPERPQVEVVTLPKDFFRGKTEYTVKIVPGEPGTVRDYPRGRDNYQFTGEWNFEETSINKKFATRAAAQAAGSARLSDMWDKEFELRYDYASSDGPSDYHYTRAADSFPASTVEYGDPDYQLPGGKNYTELLLTLPSHKGATFKPPHFQHTDNMLAHVRFNERTDTAGERVLFIEEIQSDWAQKAKKQGFTVAGADRNDPAYVAARKRATDALNAYNRAAGDPARQKELEQEKDTAIAAERAFEGKHGMPAAPFVDKTEAWVALALKRMIRYAADEGFDRIAWTTGEQQVSRYEGGLRQHVDTIEWEKTPQGVQLIGYKGRGSGSFSSERQAMLREGIHNVGREMNDLLERSADGLSSTLNDEDIATFNALRERQDDLTRQWHSMEKGTEVVNTTQKESDLSDAIGKLMADKIRNDPAQKGVISGENIKIDDTGMATFYERIVPNVANDVLKKLGGGRVGKVVIDGVYNKPTRTLASGATVKPLGESEQPGFDITPALRDKALEGMPMFARKGDEDHNFSRREGEIVNDIFSQAGKDFLTHPKQQHALYIKRGQKAIDLVNKFIGNKLSVLGDMPNEDLYTVQRGVAMGLIAQADEAAGKIGDIFNAASDADRKAVYDYWTNVYGTVNNISDPEIRKAAIETKQKIVEVGEKLVKRGLISEESFLANKGKYAPRLYLKYLLDESANRMIGIGKSISDVGYSKKRKDIPEEIRRLILGEITEPGFLGAMAVGKPLRDIALLDFLETISKNEDWAWRPSMVNYKGQLVSIAWLKNEAGRLREQATYYTDSVNKKETEDIAADMEAVYTPLYAQMGKPPENYTEIPDTPRYGLMRGMLVRNEIYNDLVGASNMSLGNRSWAENFLGYGGIGTKLQQAWKTSKVALNPPGQIRNMISNWIMLHLSGIPMHMLPKRLAQAIEAMRTKNKYWDVAHKYGVAQGNFGSQELYRMEQVLLKDSGHDGPLAFLRYAKLIATKAGDLYQLTETMSKIAKIIDVMENGGGEAEAALEAQKWLFDYSFIPRAVRYIRNAPIGIPFLTYYYKLLPRLMEVALKAPHRFLPYIAMGYVLPMIAAAGLGTTPDDLEKAKKALAEWLRDKGHVYALPWKDATGRLQFLDLSYFIPWTMFHDMVKQTAEGKFSDLLGTSGVASGILTDLFLAIKTNIDPFTKREIASKGDPVNLQVGAWMTYIYNMMAPPWLTNRGLIGPDLGDPTSNFGGKIHQNMFDTTNKFGEPRQTNMQTLGSAIGINLYPVNPGTSRVAEMQRMIGEVYDAERMLKLKLGDKGLTEAARQKVIDTYRAEMTKRIEKIKKYAEESQVPASLQ